MTNKWIDALKEEVSKHNTTAALREMVSPGVVGPEEKLKTPECRTDKTDKTTNKHKPGVKNPRTPRPCTDKTDKTTEAERLGLVATWSIEFGYISLHDPTSGEWHDLRTEDAPGWAKREAFKRKELYRDGNRKAYRLTAQEMEEIWEFERVEMWEHPDRGRGDDRRRGLLYEDDPDNEEEE